MGSGGGKSGQVTGYEYFLGIDFAWCHSAVDRVTNMYVDNKPLNTSIGTTGGTSNVSAKNLFGEYEGGVSGTITLLDGNETQVQNEYLVDKLGSNVPAYRGVTRTLLSNSAATNTSRSFYVGNNPYLKKWTGEFQRIYKRVVDGFVVDQWQTTLAGVPTIDDSTTIVNIDLEDQSIFIQVDLSSASNGFVGRDGTITGSGIDIESVKKKVINTLTYIRDNATYNRASRFLLGGLIGNTSGLTVGVGFFRFTDGAANTTNNPNSIDPFEAPIPTDAQKTSDTYDSSYNLPKRGYKMRQAAHENDISELISYVNQFVVVPDNVPNGERDASQLMLDNVTEAYATLIAPSVTTPRSNIVFSGMVNDNSTTEFADDMVAIDSILSVGDGVPLKMSFNAGNDASPTTEAKVISLTTPRDFSSVTITGGWSQLAVDPVFTGGAEYMRTFNIETSLEDADDILQLPSGDTADIPFGLPPSDAKTWYWGPLITSGIYATRFDPEELWTRSVTGETTLSVDGNNLFETLISNITEDVVTADYGDISSNNDLRRDDTVIRILGSLSGNTVTSYIEMNPAHIIRECLTDQNWGLGLAEAEIDDTYFLAAAQTLYDERFGLSLAWFRQEPIEDFVNIILNHIDAVLYVDRVEGKWRLDLIRDDYDPDLLPVYTDADVVSFDNINIKAPSELTNSVTINYNSRELRGEASLTVNNLAQIQQLGSVINTTVNYPGVWQPKLATRIAQRDLATLSTALIAGNISVTRKGFNLNPGSVFKLTSSRYNLSNEIMRVVEVDLGDGTSNQIGVSFVQDKFNLDSSANYDVVSAPTEPYDNINRPAKAVAGRVVMEEPYYLFTRRVGEAEALDRETFEPDLGYLSYTGIAPTTNALTATGYVDAGNGYEDASTMFFCPHATLDADLREYADETTLTLTNFTYYSDLSVDDLLMIDNEIMKIDSLVDSTTEITVGRGCLDTVPAYHRAGAKVFFISGSLNAYDGNYVASDSVDVKLLTNSSNGQLDPALAPVDTVLFDSRITKPYPVGKLQLGGSYSSLWDTSSGATLEATWVHRDRTLQTGDTPLDFTDASVGPETNSDYTISAVAYDFLGSELTGIGDLFSVDKNQLLTHTISTDAYSPTTEGTGPWSAVGVRVSNTRDTSPGYLNWQTPEAIAYYPVTPEETETYLEGFWVDANQISSLTTDAEGQDPVVYDGDPVGNMSNRRKF